MSDPVPGRADKSAGDAHDHSERETASRVTRPFGGAAIVVLAIVLLVAIGGIVVYVFR